jgi:hypothetical protein
LRATTLARLLVMAVALVTLVCCAAHAGQPPIEEPAETAKVSFGVSYSKLGDFGTDWGLRAQFNVKDNWLLTAGWNNVDGTVTSTGGPMSVSGDMWQLDLSYILWGMTAEEAKRTEGEYLNWYYGAGVGLRDIAADWTLFGLTSNAKKLAGSAHAVVGLHWNQFFADARYEFGGKFFGYKADGIQFSAGAVWNINVPW